MRASVQSPGPVLIDLAGPELSRVDRARLSHPLVGGVVLFARNIISREQVTRLCAAIRSTRRPGLLICVDQEGGRVQSLRDGYTRVPPMAEIGRLWDLDPLAAMSRATRIGRTIGSELRASGIDLSFTPVLDLDHGVSRIVGDRAFHRDPRVVAMLARALCHGLLLAGMANCGKHFPGHGAVRGDSHTELPIDRRALHTLLADDAAPYRWLGEALSAVMPAHVLYPRVDSHPAGYSRVWLIDILRGKLGFDGLIFSDDLNMAGAALAGSVLERGHAALAAGCDMVLVCHDAGAADALLESLQWQRSAEFDRRLEALRRPAGGVAR